MINCYETMIEKEIKDAYRNCSSGQGKWLGPQPPKLPEDGFLSDPLELSPIARQPTQLSPLL
jgi:hypothetical protein